MAGLGKEDIREIFDYTVSERFSEREKLALRYAETVTLAPWHVDDRLFEQLRGEFDDAEIVELTLVIAAYNLTNRFNIALGTDLEPVFERVLTETELPRGARSRK